MPVTIYCYLCALKRHLSLNGKGHNGVAAFTDRLREEGELLTINGFTDPELEITEIADRFIKANGKALRFNNTGTDFPVAINLFGSDRRMAMAVGRTDLDDAGREIDEVLKLVGRRSEGGILKGLLNAPRLLRYARLMPSRKRGRGACQDVIMKEPDLDRLPILKCWPHDGGRFITLPCVHTFHPDTGAGNLGMYRMQVFDSRTTGMHWHRHKTGANHFEAWKRSGRLMPVAVTLGGDPVYTYAATAPLPENIDEYILAGFLRRRRVRLVKCLTQDIWVPEDADIVIEGYVDPSDDLLWEGPFGDHTGVYSLADWYPAFHVTSISHRKDAVYPATIVGIPPQEDAWIGKATGKLFLPAIKMTLAPEVDDLYLPDAGVAHNLVIVSISKRYPGQGAKVISSLFGAGQMMFSKFIIAVSSGTDIRDPESVIASIERNCNLATDLLTQRGPLDVLDHSSDTFSIGGKMAIDATEKLPEEKQADNRLPFAGKNSMMDLAGIIAERFPGGTVDIRSPYGGVLLVTVPKSHKRQIIRSMMKDMAGLEHNDGRAVIVLFEEGVPLDDGTTLLWQLTGNTDPVRDIFFGHNLIIDARFKLPVRDNFVREWPNVVVSLPATIDSIDRKWQSLTGMEMVKSPSIRYMNMVMSGGAAINEDTSDGS
ncbi:MAG: menaquinone biosynthesis decarboxylase [Bacteroidetes bacterium]|nr:menaquinone biosynthesis decarboxylase [Bacteroidota bacterium]